jgi:hypothetical protein
MFKKHPSDLWFSNADSLPWFLVEMGLKSCYDLRYCNNNKKLIERYGIKRRECVNEHTGCGEYGHHFVFVDKEKFDKAQQKFQDEQNQSR